MAPPYYNEVAKTHNLDKILGLRQFLIKRNIQVH